MGGVPSPGFLGEYRGTGAATHPRAALTAMGTPPNPPGAAGLPQPAAPAPRRPWTAEERAAFNKQWGAEYRQPGIEWKARREARNAWTQTH